MKLEIQRVNHKINRIEDLMTNFLDNLTKNNLQVQTSQMQVIPLTSLLPKQKLLIFLENELKTGQKKMNH